MVVVGRLAWFNVEGCESERCLVIVGGVVVGGGGEFESAGGVECGQSAERCCGGSGDWVVRGVVGACEAGGWVDG